MNTRKQLLIVATIAIAAITAPAQTNQIPDLMPPVVNTVATFLTTPSTNWYAATYGIVNTKNHDTGFGLAAFYKVNDFVGAFLRIDELGGTLTMPSGNFQLQFPVAVMGRFTAVPFAFTGVAFPISKNVDSTVAGIFGAGFAFRLPQATAWYVPKDILIDVEKWTNVEGLQVRAGVAWKF
jgi:hypothetical protein